MFKWRVFLISLFLVFIISIPVFPAVTRLPYLFSSNGAWYPPNPNWIVSDSSTIDSIEQILSKVTKPINYCDVCKYRFWLKVRAILSEDNPQKRPYWYDGVKLISARFVNGRCLFYHSTSAFPYPADSNVAGILQKSIDEMKDTPDRQILYAEVRGGSDIYPPFLFNHYGCDKPFELPSKPQSCPNVHIRSLPVVRVRVRC
jgi:hypothetical protein